MMNTISILGSTGSIGRQTLDVAEQLGLRVAALTANSNVERMEAQCRKFRPRLAVMTAEAAAKELAVRLQDTTVKVLAGSVSSDTTIEMSLPLAPGYFAVTTSVPMVTVALAELEAVGRYSSTFLGAAVRLLPLNISRRNKFLGLVMSYPV